MLVTKHEWELQKFHVLLSTVLYSVPPKQFSRPRIICPRSSVHCIIRRSPKAIFV